MAKNNVGSLYVEILLAPDGYKKGAAAIRRDQSALSSFLKKDIKDVLTEREAAAAEARRLGEANWRANKNDLAKRKEVQKAIIRSYKRRIREIDAAEENAAQDQADRGLAGVAKTIQHINKVKAAKLKAIEDIRNMGKNAGGAGGKRGGLMGLFDHFGQGGGITSFLSGKGGLLGTLGKVTGSLSTMSLVIGKTALFVWPLVQAFKALSKAAGAVVSAIGKAVEVVDNFRMQNIKIAKFMDGDVKGASRLVNEIEQYAIATSLSVDAGLDMAGSLLVLGIRASDVTTRLKQFNSVAMGDTTKFKRIAKAYTDVIGAQVLKRTELNQFKEAGVGLNTALEQMLRNEGRWTGNLDDMISNRKITAEDVGKALDIVAEKFKGLDTATLNTVKGQIENLQEEFVSWIRHSKEVKKITDAIVSSLKNIGRTMQDVKPFIDDFMSVFLGAKFEGAIKLVSHQFELIATHMKAMAMMKAFFETGNATEYVDRIRLAESVLEAEEEIARAKADAAEAEEAAMKKREEATRRYMDLIKGFNRADESAQGKYQSWHADNNVSEMTAMQQLSLITAYYNDRLRAAKEERDKALEDIEKSKKENEKSRLEAALQAALPSEMFKQNSVEEFRYLQEQRKQAERDRREQQNFETEQANRKAEADSIVTAVSNLDLTNTTGI